MQPRIVLQDTDKRVSESIACLGTHEPRLRSLRKQRRGYEVVGEVKGFQGVIKNEEVHKFGEFTLKYTVLASLRVQNSQSEKGRKKTVWKWGRLGHLHNELAN